ncbi:hypothetical protein IEQ34_017229 [Dendrobium chrysotoxum]|uniref:Uncharacterized protein n=1 Tax=Dendrobium chrysotoxum TaxID=161865 RepID=A0AAV7G9P6_DENCH|nr:hypothetical protein IEQ34_017229 [Dendrobium chrysotoxum]
MSGRVNLAIRRVGSEFEFPTRLPIRVGLGSTRLNAGLRKSSGVVLVELAVGQVNRRWSKKARFMVGSREGKIRFEKEEQ